VAWNTGDGTPKTGDAANITVRIRKDGGTLTAATNNPVEVDATNAPGLYEIELTASEMDANTIEVVPRSTTDGVQCSYCTILTERGRIDASISSVAGSVWSHTTRTLTSFGTLVNDVASAVWSHSTRTLTAMGTLANDTANAVWSYTVEASQSAVAWLRLMGAALFNKRVVSGSTYTHRDWADTKDRIVGTVDSSGNRTITTRDGS
jgi:hypothetical protein